MFVVRVTAFVSIRVITHYHCIDDLLVYLYVDSFNFADFSTPHA